MPGWCAIHLGICNVLLANVTLLRLGNNGRDELLSILMCRFSRLGFNVDNSINSLSVNTCAGMSDDVLMMIRLRSDRGVEISLQHVRCSKDGY